MIKNQLYPYIEKYINEYLLGFTKEQLNIGLTNGSIILEKLFIRPDTTNEKLDSFDIPIWLKLGTIKNIHIGCSLMNFLGDNPLEIEINDIELIICPSFRNVVRNLNSFIQEKESHFIESYDAADNNSHEIFGQKVNLCDASKNKKAEEIYKIFHEKIDKSKMANIFNQIYTKALLFYYQKNYLIKIKIKNTSVRFEDDFFNYFGKSVSGIRIPLIDLILSVDGLMKKNNFKVDNIIIYYEKEPTILISSKFFLSNINEEGKFDVNNYFEKVNKEKLTNDTKKEILLLNSFSCMGNFGIKTIEKEKIDFFSKNKAKKHNFFIQLATNEIQLNLYADFLNKLESFDDFVRSFFINELIQYFKPMRKPYLKSSELVKKYCKDPKIMTKRRLIVRDWFYYMIWYTRVKKAVYGFYFKNAIQEEFSKFYNIGLSVNGSENNGLDNAQFKIKNLNDSIDLKKDLKTDLKDTSNRLNPDNIIMTIDNETLIKGFNLTLHNDKHNIVIKINSLKSSIKVDREQGHLVVSFKDLYISPSNKILIDKDIDDKLYQKVEKSITISYENTDVCSKINDDEIENKLNIKQNLFIKGISSKDIYKASYNSNESFKNPKLLLLNEALDQLGSSNNLTAINKNKVNSYRSGNILKELIGNIGIQEDKCEVKEKKNRELSEMINEFNRSFANKNKNPSLKNQLIFKTQNTNSIVSSEKLSNKIMITSNQKVCLNLLEIQSGDNTSHAFSFSFTKKLDRSNIVSDNIHTSVGFIRINYVHDYLVNALNVFLPFKHIINKITNRLKHVIKIDLKTEKELYIMRKYMLNKLSIKDFSDQIKKFINYLKFNIDLIESDDEIKKQGHFAVNYFSNILNKKIYDISLAVSDILVLGFDSKPFENILSTKKNSSKVKFPKVNFKFFFSNEKIYANIFDFEFQYQNANMLATVVKDVFNIISSNYTAQLILVNPTIKKLQAYYKKMEKEKKLKEMQEKNKKKLCDKDSDIPFLNIMSNNIGNRNGIFDLGKKNNNLSNKESNITNLNISKVLKDKNIFCNPNSGKRISDNSFKSSISEINSNGNLDIPIPTLQGKMKNFFQIKNDQNDDDLANHLKSDYSLQEEESLDLHKITPKIYKKK